MPCHPHYARPMPPYFEDERHPVTYPPVGYFDPYPLPYAWGDGDRANDGGVYTPPEDDYGPGEEDLEGTLETIAAERAHEDHRDGIDSDPLELYPEDLDHLRDVFGMDDADIDRITRLFHDFYNRTRESLQWAGRFGPGPRRYADRSAPVGYGPSQDWPDYLPMTAEELALGHQTGVNTDALQNFAIAAGRTDLEYPHLPPVIDDPDYLDLLTDMGATDPLFRDWARRATEFTTRHSRRPRQYAQQPAPVGYAFRGDRTNSGNMHFDPEAWQFNAIRRIAELRLTPRYRGVMDPAAEAAIRAEHGWNDPTWEALDGEGQVIDTMARMQGDRHLIDPFVPEPPADPEPTGYAYQDSPEVRANRAVEERFRRRMALRRRERRNRSPFPDEGDRVLPPGDPTQDSFWELDFGDDPEPTGYAFNPHRTNDGGFYPPPSPPVPEVPLGDYLGEYEDMADAAMGMMRNYGVQVDPSGRGHAWRDVDDSIPHDIRQEIEAEILDGGHESHDGYRASNGEIFRWGYGAAPEPTGYAFADRNRTNSGDLYPPWSMARRIAELRLSGVNDPDAERAIREHQFMTDAMWNVIDGEEGVQDVLRRLRGDPPDEDPEPTGYAAEIPPPFPWTAEELYRYAQIYGLSPQMLEVLPHIASLRGPEDVIDNDDAALDEEIDTAAGAGWDPDTWEAYGDPIVAHLRGYGDGMPEPPAEYGRRRGWAQTSPPAIVRLPADSPYTSPMGQSRPRRRSWIEMLR